MILKVVSGREVSKAACVVMKIVYTLSRIDSVIISLTNIKPCCKLQGHYMRVLRHSSKL